MRGFLHLSALALLLGMFAVAGTLDCPNPSPVTPLRRSSTLGFKLISDSTLSLAPTDQILARDWVQVNPSKDVWCRVDAESEYVGEIVKAQKDIYGVGLKFRRDLPQ